MQLLPIYCTVQMINGDKSGPLIHCTAKVKGEGTEKCLWCPHFPTHSSNSSAAYIWETGFLTLPCTVLSNDMPWSCWPGVVYHPILMTSKFPSAKCFWLRARGFYRGRVSDRKSEGQRGLQGEWVKEEDICNTNRSLSLPPHHWPGRTPGAACLLR